MQFLVKKKQNRQTLQYFKNHFEVLVLKICRALHHHINVCEYITHELATATISNIFQITVN